jgi:hypothetical protein
MILHNVSGIPTPRPDTFAAFVNAAGVFTGERPDGSTVSLEIGNPGVSGLTDVSGIFSSGQTLTKGATFFTPQAAGSYTTPVLTIVSSGMIDVCALLNSGVIVNGASPTTIVWSGIDQTYDRLEIRGVIRAQANLATVSGGIYFNGDVTAANYQSRRIYSASDTAIEHATFADSYAYIAQGLPALDSSTGATCPLHLQIFQYAQSGFRKQVTQVGIHPSMAATTFANPSIHTVMWQNTTGPAISVIELKCLNATPTFCSGTEVYLFGHKKVWAITSGIYGTAGIVNGRFV